MERLIFYRRGTGEVSATPVKGRETPEGLEMRLWSEERIFPCAPQGPWVKEFGVQYLVSIEKG